jgi:N-acetylneuraminic acid mutarotase
MPERVANNATTQATVGGIPYVFSFSGIDFTKECGSNHLKSFRYNTVADEWEFIAPLPDPMGGKIAAGASTVKNKIYIIGGYHVNDMCSEVSSKKVHIYDPETNEYLPDGVNIPKAIDDHIQVVWRDSLIFVVTGWSNTNNVTNVQIYNPTKDEWMTGKSIPSHSQWRVFGGSGTIIGDTLYYAGGAGNWNGSTFPPTTTLRKGFINPNDPTDILWVGVTSPLAKGYRMGASDYNGSAVWIGGSDETYNFDGIAYNGSGGVPPLDRIKTYNPQTGQITDIDGFIPKIMDLRGVAKISDNEYIIAGGMEENQEVTNRTFLITIDNLSHLKEVKISSINIFPNPFQDHFSIEKEGIFDIEIYNTFGQKMIEKQVSGFEKIQFNSLPKGVYWLSILNNGQRQHFQKIIKQ